MKHLNTLAGVTLLTLAFCGHARGDVLVDTGTPKANSLFNTLYGDNSFGGQWLAAEFNANQSWNIDSIKGYILADTNNPDNATFSISLYANNANNLPDMANQLYTQQAAFTADGWNGVNGLNWNIAPGAYWVAFEVTANDSLQGLMPGNVPQPLLKTAVYDGVSLFGYQAVSGINTNIGVQISSVPLPGGIWLFASGLAVLMRKRQAV